ncbi:MAG: signal peptide peptidase SppA [Deltaproteobacteria bacterium]|nr:signal peptide peptidase SppA [Deltaproteobacteria bacterium]
MLLPLAANSLRLALLPLLHLRHRTLVPKGSWVRVKLEGPLTELSPPAQRWLRAVRPQVSVAGLRMLAEAVAQDDHVAGVLFELRGVACGWATAQSVRDVVGALRAAGKKTVAYLPFGASTREYHLAVACDTVLIAPQASLAPLGVAAGSTFLKGLLARGGIEAEVLARKEFKSAGESFSRDGFSEANRQQLDALLDRFQGAFLQAISDGRRVDLDRARSLVDNGPYRPSDGVRDGLVDALAYEDQVPSHLGPKGTKVVSAPVYLRLRRALRFSPVLPAQRVGVVEVRGAIVPQSRYAFGSVADAERIVGALRVARAVPRIGAVVLYVDSRGGSALASDVIAREVERVQEEKPVVAYFSDVAASGGYYVAAPTRAIVAQPTTVTGSIGVIAMRFLASGTLGLLGVGQETLRRGARADLMSPYRRWDEGDRAAVEREIDGFYNDFVATVARGRKRSPEDVEPVARGRVWAGSDARDVGLVDALGGLDTAIARARELAGGRFHDDPVLISPPRNTPPPAELPSAMMAVLSSLAEQHGGVRALDALQLALSSPHERLFAFEDADVG